MASELNIAVRMMLMLVVAWQWNECLGAEFILNILFTSIVATF